jgi:hypothetical protein
VQKILRQGGVEDVKRIGRSHTGERGGGRGRRQPAPALRRPLTDAEIGVLRSVVAELGALHAMLGDVDKAETAAPRPKRAAAGG